MNVYSGSVFFCILLLFIIFHSTLVRAASNTSGTMRLHVISKSPVTVEVSEFSQSLKQESLTTIAPNSAADIEVPTSEPYVISVSEVSKTDKIANSDCSATFNSNGTPYVVNGNIKENSNNRCHIETKNNHTIAIVVSDKHS